MEPPSEVPLSRSCTFCKRLSLGQLLFERESVVAFRCSYPASRGHMLIVPRRHEHDLLHLPELELAAVWDLTAEVCEWVRGEYGPDGLNVGANIGPSAGQTIAHANVHVIPRYAGDVEDPRGGIRMVKPETARWWDNRA